MKTTILILFSLLSIMSCSLSEKSPTQPKLTEFKHLGFSGEQSHADFSLYAEKGYKRVVNLREVGEAGFSKEQALQQRQKAQAAGLEYIDAPFLKKDVAGKTLTSKKMETIEAAVMGDGSRQKTLITCSSGARATAWLAWHMSEKHKMDFEKAKKMSFKLGPQDENAQKALEAVEALLQK